MAYKTSAEYQNLIYDEDSIQELEIIIDDIEINYDYVKSFSYKDNIFENDFFSLGSTITSQIELECDNEIFETIKKEITEIDVKFKLQISSDEYEVIPLKKYILKSSSNVSDNYTKFVFCDYMMKFDDATIDFSDKLPLTRYELLKEICNEFGVKLFNTSIVNGNIIVGSYDNTIPVKTWISCICERAGAFAKINRNNQLEIKSFNTIDEISLPSELVGDFKTNEKKVITKVIYENGIPQKFEAGTDTGEIIYLNSDSPFSCTQDEVDNIYEVLNGLEYQSFECKIWGDPSIDTGDIIIFNDIKSFAQMSWNFGNGFYGSYKTSLEKNNKASVINRIPIKTRINKISSKIDEVEGKVQTTIEDTNELEKRVLQVEETADSFNIEIVNEKINNATDGLESKIDDVKSKINDNSSKIDTLAGQITNMNFNFSTGGLSIGVLGEDISSNLDNKGLKIYNLDTLIAIFNKNGSGVNKLIVTDSFQLQNLLLKKRQIERKDTGSTIDVISGFWLIDLIENLTDLEVD